MKKLPRIEDHFILIHQPNHPRAYAAGYVPEHILVAEKTLGRSLMQDEDIRHINGDSRDNRPANLEIISNSNGYKSQSINDSSDITRASNSVNGKTFVSCAFQRVCWKTVRAPIARENKVYLPYICSFQTEGDLYHCSHFWKFFEADWAEKNKVSSDKE